MSVDRPGSTGDSEPDQPARAERRPVNWDLSTPMPGWVRDQPREQGDRPFPGVPADRPPPPPRAPDTRSVAELRAEMARYATPREYAEAMESRSQATLKTVPEGTAKASRESSEATRASGTAESTDVAADARTDQRTDSAADKATDKAADAERIEKLENDLAESKTDQRKLIGVVSRQTDKIDTLESERDTARAEAADAKAEIARLRAELEKKDRPAEVETEVDASPDAVAGQSRDDRQAKPDSPWYKKIPSEGVTGLVTAGATAAETVGVVTHTMSGTAETVVGAVMGVGVAALAYKREKRKEKDGQDG